MSTSRLVGLVVLTLSPLIAPYVAGGQTPGNAHRVGIIHHGDAYHVVVDGLRQGLRELGLEEGKHFVPDIRETKGELKAVEAAARELERGNVDLIYTVTTSVTIAAKRATAQTPIVFSTTGRCIRHGRRLDARGGFGCDPALLASPPIAAGAARRGRRCGGL